MDVKDHIFFVMIPLVDQNIIQFKFSAFVSHDLIFITNKSSWVGLWSSLGLPVFKDLLVHGRVNKKQPLHDKEDVEKGKPWPSITISTKVVEMMEVFGLRILTCF